MDNLEMSKFTWRIENFSQLHAKYHNSLTFVMHKYKWKLSLLPIRLNGYLHLSLYLCVADSSSLPAGWRIPTNISISIVNQIHPNKTIKKECEQTFNSLVASRCWKFNVSGGGYLVEDTCLIEAVVDVPPSSPAKDLDSWVVVAYMEAQSFLESLLPKTPSSPASNSPTCERPLFKGHVTFAKEIFDKLISYHMNDLADPNNESAMMDFISVLANSISAFSDAQAKEIVNLRATFPQIVQEWRHSIQVKGTGEPARSTFEETKSVLQHLVKREEGIRTELEELRKKEMELGAELEAIESKSMMPKEERDRVSKNMKIVYCLVEERASKIGVGGLELDCANQQLEQRLKSKWTAMRSLFAKRKKCDGE